MKSTFHRKYCEEIVGSLHGSPCRLPTISYSSGTITEVLGSHSIEGVLTQFSFFTDTMATATIYLALALCCAVEGVHLNFRTNPTQLFLENPSLHLSGPGAAFARVAAFTPQPARLPVNGFGWENYKKKKLSLQKINKEMKKWAC